MRPPIQETVRSRSTSDISRPHRPRARTNGHHRGSEPARTRYHAVNRSKGDSVDALDRRILIELQRDGSLTNARLAERVGLSQSAMSERVRRLEGEGHI
ncbi:MAG TPA: AsnC family transcriptional regulator, partial [Thermoleophilia bacterium]|nr:AsnC family transcriptional regulator [Thermoleophilia bacterium]